MEYLDIEAACKKIGAPPTRNVVDALLYTLPVIYDPNTQTAVSDSAAIARYLDRTYPAAGPPLIPAELDALHGAFEAAFARVTFGAGDIVRLSVPAMWAVLAENPRSAEYVRRTREAYFGPLEELAPAGSEKCRVHWEGARRSFGTIASWLGEDAGGERLLFMGGDRICYADVIVAALLKNLQKVLPAEEWQEVMAWDGGRWERFMDVFKPYEAEDVGAPMEL